MSLLCKSFITRCKMIGYWDTDLTIFDIFLSCKMGILFCFRFVSFCKHFLILYCKGFRIYVNLIFFIGDYIWKGYRILFHLFHFVNILCRCVLFLYNRSVVLGCLFCLCYFSSVPCGSVSVLLNCLLYITFTVHSWWADPHTTENYFNTLYYSLSLSMAWFNLEWCPGAKVGYWALTGPHYAM